MTVTPTKTLLVEDNPGDARLVMEMAREGGVADIRHVERLADALAHLSEARVDIVLLDLGLPDSQGLATLHSLLAVERAPPIIVLTGNSDEEFGRAAVGAGAEEFLVKGHVNAHALMRAIHYAVERGAFKARLQHLNSVLRAIRSINRLIVREKDRNRLTQGACDLLVDARDFKAAWIVQWATAEHPARLASAGSASVETIEDALERNESPGCFRQVTTNGFVVLNPAVDCRDCPARREHEDGWTVAMPIRHEAHYFGILSVRLPDGTDVDENEKELLLEVAGDLGYALYAIEAERGREAYSRIVRESQAALAKSEANFRHLVENINDVIYSMDIEGWITYISPVVRQKLGWSPEDVVGRRCLDFAAPQDHETLKAALQDHLEGRSRPREVRLLDKAGKTVWMRSSSRPVYQDGRVIGLRGILSDISDRKAAEEATERTLQELASRQRETEALLTAVTSVVNESDFNSAARRIFDVARDVTGAESGYVALLTPDGAENEVLFLESGGHPCDVDPELPMPIRGLRAESYRSGRAVLDNDFANSRWAAFMPAGHLTLRNVMFAPLNVKGKTVGLMGLANKPTDFTDNDLRMAENLAHFAALALQKSRSFEALRESAQHFRNLADSGKALVWTAGLDKMCDYFNQPWLDFTGRSFEQERGMGWTEGVHPEDLDRCVETYSGAFDRREPFSMTYRLRRHDGQYRWIQDEGSARYDSEGRFIGYIGHCLDISERVEIENALAERNRVLAVINDLTHELAALPSGSDPRPVICERLRELTCAVAAWFAEYQGDMGGLVLRAHKIEPSRQQELLANAGEPPAGLIMPLSEQMRERMIHEIVLECDSLHQLSGGVMSEEVAARLKALLASDRFVALSHVVDGFLYGVTVLALPAHQTCPPRDLLQSIAHVAAVTLRRRNAEDALRESERRYAAIVDNAGEGILVVDLDTGRPIHANPAICRMLDYAPPELLGLDAKVIYPPEERERLATELAATTDGGARVCDVPCLRKDGSVVYADIGSTPIWLGSRRCVVQFFADTTARKRMAEQFQAAQKMEAVGRLAGGIAHDFNNALSVINGYAELAMQALPKDQPVHKNLQQIHHAGEHAANLTRQLLAFSRKQVFSLELLDLNKAVSETEKMLRRLIGEDIGLSFTGAPDLWHVRADRGQMEQVLMNLVINARDAMPMGGRLTIETANVELDEEYARAHMDVTPGPHVMLAITDSGCGMDEETRKTIFEPFFTTKEAGKGTGLGLASVYGIVRQTGGTIWVYSEVDRGTTFKIYLPRAEGHVDETPRSETDLQTVSGCERVLVVEDEDGVRELVRMALGTIGYEVVVARDGREALETCAALDGLDVLLTDMVMPGMDGRQLAQSMQQRFPELKVLFMSGYTEHAVAQQGVLEPGTAFISKPFEIAALARRVREILDGEGATTD